MRRSRLNLTRYAARALAANRRQERSTSPTRFCSARTRAVRHSARSSPTPAAPATPPPRSPSTGRPRATRARRDVLLIDARGTGKSGALTCPSLAARDLLGIDKTTIGTLCAGDLAGRSGLYAQQFRAVAVRWLAVLELVCEVADQRQAELEAGRIVAGCHPASIVGHEHFEPLRAPTVTDAITVPSARPRNACTTASLTASEMASRMSLRYDSGTSCS
jgi:hypothetical protein